MWKLRPTVHSDLDRIKNWIAADSFHNNDNKHSAEWLLTPGGLLAMCLEDSQGPLCYARLDQEVDMVRLATQFGPESEVSKKRLVVGLLHHGVPAIIKFSMDRKYRGIVFESVSDSLIKFMATFGFVHDKNDDYALIFEEN